MVNHPTNLEVIRGDPEIDVFGTTLPGSILEISYDNREDMERDITLRADSTGRFIATIPLAEGFNVIEVISHNSASPEPRHQLLQLTYDSSPLTLFLVVTDPADGVSVTDRVVTISGETLPGAEVVVNEIIPAIPDSSGIWRADIRLQTGANEIRVRAFYEGNVVQTTVALNYER